MDKKDLSKVDRVRRDPVLAPVIAKISEIQSILQGLKGIEVHDEFLKNIVDAQIKLLEEDQKQMADPKHKDAIVQKFNKTSPMDYVQTALTVKLKDHQELLGKALRYCDMKAMGDRKVLQGWASPKKDASDTNLDPGSPKNPRSGK